jgi:hypothetical protein
MRRLLTKDKAPPVDASGISYRYFHADGHVSRAMDWWTWEGKIREHIIGNGGEVPVNIMAIAEDQLCGTIPPDQCIYETGDMRPTDVRITLQSVGDWVKAVVQKVIGGEDYVSQEEANRRAAICVSCPYNVVASGGCSGCEKLAELLTPGMAQRKTQYDDKLKNCAVCGCFNQIAVHFPLAVLADGDKPYPDFCWRKSNG